jgi:uncharacterized delta-60 repeat protein
MTKADVDAYLNTDMSILSSYNNSQLVPRVKFSPILTGGFNNGLTGMILQSDGKMVVIGYFTQFNTVATNRIIRLNLDGTRDTSFNTGSGFMYNYSVNGLGVLSNGQIIVAGNFDRYNGVLCPMMIKLNSDGTRDTSFHYTGTGTSLKYINDIHITLDLINGADKITITVYDSLTNTSSLESYLYNGYLDTVILSGDSTNTVNGAITAIHLLQSSPVDLYLLSGPFTELRTSSGNIPANKIIRIDSNGNKDNTFNYGTGFSGSYLGVNVIIFQSNGKYLLGGSFTSYNSTTADRIVRLNQDGTRG